MVRRHLEKTAESPLKRYYSVIAAIYWIPCGAFAFCIQLAVYVIVFFDFECLSAGHSSGSSKLLLKMSTKLEEVRQAVNGHTATLQSILRRLNATEDMVAASLPAGVTFPLDTYADVESIKEKLCDVHTKNTLVCKNRNLYSTEIAGIYV